MIRAVLAALLLLSATAAADDEPRIVEYASYEELLGLYAGLGYTMDAWRAGERAVPRVVLAHVPERWRGGVSDEIGTALKKELFFRVLAPLALIVNEAIAADRERLSRLPAEGPADDGDAAWLDGLAMRYGVIDAPDAALGPDQMAELVRRVDGVPVSLVLAQAAEESGWGTSRFADLGNAVFGQWTWADDGIVPEHQREELGDHRIRAFDTVLDSVASYMLNLNSHFAYEDLRQLREAIRGEGRPVTGHELAGGLASYSERGMAYVDGLRALMEHNHLATTDEAYLADGPTLLLMPVGDGSE